ncbi:MAG: ATP-binding protein [Bacteroidales bacterium]
MKIKKLILENFRGFYGRNEIEFDDFTVFIGKNDQGKSSVLEAIDIFINEGKNVVKIDNNDLNLTAKNEGEDQFTIGIVFKDLPDEIIIDETNRTNLKDEYLLNRDGDLEIYKIFKNGKYVDKETYIKAYHPGNDDFIMDILKKKINELRDFVNQNNIQCSDNRKSAELRRSIREYYRNKYGDLNLNDIDIKVSEEEVKNIWNKLNNYMPIYSIFHSDRTNTEQDSEIQDPLKAKVEAIFRRDDIRNKLNEIAQEIDTQLKDVANNTINKFQEITGQQDSIIPNIPDVTTLKWKDVYKNISYNTGDGIPLNKRGSGIRRLVLLSSFLAELESNHQDNNHIIYAIEEPETSLHPDLQKILINSLIKLSKNGKYQIFISTHSPALIRLFETSAIKYVEKINTRSKVEPFNENIIDKIIKTMGLLPNMGKLVVCVEGTNDEQFLLNINQNIPELKSIINLKDKKESGLISIIPMRGSNLVDWIDRYALKNTNAVEFHLYDKDIDEQYKDKIEKVNNRKDGSYGTLTKKREIENYVPKEIIEEEFKIQISLNSSENWDEIDVPGKIQSIRNDLKGKDKVIKEIICGKCSKQITKQHLENLGAWDEVKGWFEKIKDLTDKVINNE